MNQQQLLWANPSSFSSPSIFKKNFSLIYNLNLPSSSLNPNCSDASPKEQGRPSIALLLFSCSRGCQGKFPKESADNLACCLLRALLPPSGQRSQPCSQSPWAGIQSGMLLAPGATREALAGGFSTAQQCQLLSRERQEEELWCFHQKELDFVSSSLQPG